MARLAIIGHGRLATALAHTFGDRVVVLAGRDDDVLRHDFDVLWIATTDAAIADVAEAIAPRRARWDGLTVVHSAGAIGPSVLEPFSQRGARTLALHPNVSLTGDEPVGPGTIWGVTPCDERSMTAADEILAGSDPRLVAVDEKRRVLYHAAATAAANFSLTLFAAAERLYAAAGVEATLARELVAAFARTSIERAESTGPRAALTGPIARGDDTVVVAQLRSIAREVPELSHLFAALADATRALLVTARR
jgi:predicted short-subunit dehydrogenase-like oxidoreductase (DUF2520 family)